MRGAVQRAIRGGDAGDVAGGGRGGVLTGGGWMERGEGGVGGVDGGDLGDCEVKEKMRLGVHMWWPYFLADCQTIILSDQPRDPSKTSLSGSKKPQTKGQQHFKLPKLLPIRLPMLTSFVVSRVANPEIRQGWPATANILSLQVVLQQQG